jgi:hypothetical protein
MSFPTTTGRCLVACIPKIADCIIAQTH